MNIQKSKVIAVPETSLEFSIRIDLVKAIVSPNESRVHWKDIYGCIHVAKDGTPVGEGRFIVTISDKTGNFPLCHLQWAGCPYLTTQSRMQAEACYNAWVKWAQEFANTEETLNYNKPRLLPKHSEFWNL